MTDLYIQRLEKQLAQRRDTIARLEEQLRLSQKKAAGYKRQLKKLIPWAAQAQTQLAEGAVADALRKVLDEIGTET